MTSLFCFNPRARDGREAVTVSLLPNLSCFNPRARDGRELIPFASLYAHTVSIHAPVMDAN